MKKAPILASLCLCALVVPVTADTFTLKDGTVLEGAVIKEDPEFYTLDVQVTKSIKDERKIAKADVKKVDRAQADLIAFAGIEKLVPTPDFMTGEEYLPRIAAVNKFLEQNRGSTKSKDARAILDTLKAELSVISAGGMKLNGKMISPAEYEANKYDLDARVTEAKIHSLIDGGQILAGLRAFSDFDKDYRTTLSYGSLAPYMIRVIKGYVEDAKLSLSTIDARIKEREVGLQRMSPADRKGTETAINEENAEIEARYQSEKAGKGIWPTLTPYHKASLTDTIRFGESEITRLSAIKTVLGVDGGKTYRDLYSAIKSGANATTVSNAMTAAKSAMVSPRYLEPLDAQYKASTKKP